MDLRPEIVCLSSCGLPFFALVPARPADAADHRFIERVVALVPFAVFVAPARRPHPVFAIVPDRTSPNRQRAHVGAQNVQCHFGIAIKYVVVIEHRHDAGLSRGRNFGSWDICRLFAGCLSDPAKNQLFDASGSGYGSECRLLARSVRL